MTIQELAHKANVTVRTIRYYVEQGVLPPPSQGRPSRYSEEHLQRLNLIRDLKAQHLPLEEVRELMSRLSLAQVRDMLARTRPATNSSLSSATEYIESVMRRAAVREEAMQYAPALPHYSAPAEPSPPPSAPAAQPAAPKRSGPAPPPYIRAMSSEVAAPMQSEVATLAESTRGRHTGDATTWRRVTLTPGIELHYATDETTADARANLIVGRLIEAARRILEELPEKETE
jgi:DNA-binding transcriptional MerR regulator